MESRLTGNLAGRYDLTDRLGRGGMGDVYKATDTTLDRPVAVVVRLKTKTIIAVVAGAHEYPAVVDARSRLHVALCAKFPHDFALAFQVEADDA